MLPLARILMILGLVIFLFGGLLYLGSRLDLPVGRLPGDLRVERDNFTFSFPLATSIILSILLTIGLNILFRFLNR